MLIISVRDNENNRWRKNAKKQKQRQAIVKAWELDDFLVHLG